MKQDFEILKNVRHTLEKPNIPYVQEKEGISRKMVTQRSWKIRRNLTSSPGFLLLIRSTSTWHTLDKAWTPASYTLWTGKFFTWNGKNLGQISNAKNSIQIHLKCFLKKAVVYHIVQHLYNMKHTYFIQPKSTNSME